VCLHVADAAAERDDDAFGEFLSGVPDMTTASPQPWSSASSSAADADCHTADNGADAGPTAVKQDRTGENLCHGKPQPFIPCIIRLTAVIQVSLH